MDGILDILDILMEEEEVMIKDKINRWKKIVSRFVDILKKLNSKGKDSKKIRQTLLHWCYELNKLF